MNGLALQRRGLWLPGAQPIGRRLADAVANSFSFRWTGADRSGNSCKTCGCPAVVKCAYCTAGTTPSQMQITLGGLINSNTCLQCAPNLNATFLLNPPSSNPSDPQPLTPKVNNCTWWLQIATIICGYTFEIDATIYIDVPGVYIKVDLWCHQQLDLTTPILTWQNFLNSDYTQPVNCGIDMDLTNTAANGNYFLMSDGGRACKTNSSLTDPPYTCHAKAIA